MQYTTYDVMMACLFLGSKNAPQWFKQWMRKLPKKESGVLEDNAMNVIKNRSSVPGEKIDKRPELDIWKIHFLCMTKPGLVADIQRGRLHLWDNG